MKTAKQSDLAHGGLAMEQQKTLEFLALFAST